MKNKKPMIILISGPSNSGKGVIAKKISTSALLSEKKIETIEIDNFAKSITKDPKDYKGFGDFNHPANFSRGQTISLNPADIIIIEGVHALQPEELRNIANLKIYLDIDDDLKLIGKIKRSVYHAEMMGEPPVDVRNYGKNYAEAFDL